MTLRPDQNLIGANDARGIELGAANDLGLAVAARHERLAGPDLHRQPHDRIVLRLPMHLGEHGVGRCVGEKAATLDGRQLRGVAEYQQRHLEGQQIAREIGVDHRAFVDDDELGLGGGGLVPELEARRLLLALARLVDQAVDGRGAMATLRAHHAGGLAGEGGEQHLAVDTLGDVLGERGLAGAGIAEQTEDRGAAAPGLEPVGDRT